MAKREPNGGAGFQKTEPEQRNNQEEVWALRQKNILTTGARKGRQDCLDW